MPSTDFNISVATEKRAASEKLRLGALTALVIGSILESGGFSLPQNMATGTGLLAVVIGWSITAVGVLALAFAYESPPVH